MLALDRSIYWQERLRKEEGGAHIQYIINNSFCGCCVETKRRQK